MLHVMGLQVVGVEDVLYFCLLAILVGMEDLSSLTRDWTHSPCSGSTEF